MSAHVPGPWPALPYAAWKDTLETLHMEMQILGKVRVELSEPEPEWAHVALSITARGISTGPVPSPRGIFEVEADFFDQRVYVRTSWGEVHSVALAAPGRRVLGRLHRRAVSRRRRRRAVDHAARGAGPDPVP